MIILRYKVFSKIIMIFLFTIFCFFPLWKISPPGQGEVRQRVKEKCIRSQGEVLPLNVWYSAEEVRQGSRRSASGVREKCFRWMCGIQLKHFFLTPDALFLDPRRTSPWPLMHFSLTPDALLLDLEGLFFRFENSKKLVKEKSKIIF